MSNNKKNGELARQALCTFILCNTIAIITTTDQSMADIGKVIVAIIAVLSLFIYIKYGGETNDKY